jgi:hypothetical protein
MQEACSEDKEAEKSAHDGRMVSGTRDEANGVLNVAAFVSWDGL